MSKCVSEALHHDHAQRSLYRSQALFKKSIEDIFVKKLKLMNREAVQISGKTEKETNGRKRIQLPCRYTAETDRFQFQYGLHLFWHIWYPLPIVRMFDHFVHLNLKCSTHSLIRCCFPQAECGTSQLWSVKLEAQWAIFCLFSFCVWSKKSWNLLISLRNQMFAAPQNFETSCIVPKLHDTSSWRWPDQLEHESWSLSSLSSLSFVEMKTNSIYRIYRTDVSNVPILESQKRFGCGCRSNAIWKIVSGVRQAEVGMSPAASRDVILRHRIDSPYVMTSKKWTWSI